MGGFINQNVTWRATFYLIIAWSGCELLALYFFVPETFLPVALKNAAMDERIRTKDGRWYAPMERSGKKVSDVFPKALYVPVQLMLAEKMALAMDLWTSLILGGLVARAIITAAYRREYRHHLPIFQRYTVHLPYCLWLVSREYCSGIWI